MITMFSPRHSATHKMTKFPLKTGEVEVLTFEVKVKQSGVDMSSFCQ